MPQDICRSYKLSPSPSTEIGKTTVSQFRVFENYYLCQLDFKIGTGALITEKGVGPTFSIRGHLGYQNFGLTGYYDHFFSLNAGEPDRNYLGGYPNYSFRSYPRSYWTQHSDHVSTHVDGWYHRLRVGVPLGGTSAKERGSGFHYGLSLDYSAAPDWIWPLVESPLNLGVKFLATEFEDKRDFSGMITLDLNFAWGILALASGGNYYNHLRAKLSQPRSSIN